MRNDTRVVIIGGGAMVSASTTSPTGAGAPIRSIEKANHLARPGMLPASCFIGDLNMAKVHQEAISLYPAIEAETGLSAAGRLRRLRFAITDEDVLWHRQVSAQLDRLGIENEIVGRDRELNPLMENIDDVGALWTPNDGWADPTGTTNALAKGARQLGAQVIRNNRVTDMNALPDGRCGSHHRAGPHRVRARGQCRRPLRPAGRCHGGLDVPIVSVIHQYLITEPLDAMKALDWEIPVTATPYVVVLPPRDRRHPIGPYETAGAQTYGVDGID